MVYIKSNPNQTLLLPTNLRDIIPKDHICFLIEEVIQQLDFSDFDKKVKGPGFDDFLKNKIRREARL